MGKPSRLKMAALGLAYLLPAAGLAIAGVRLLATPGFTPVTAAFLLAAGLCLGAAVFGLVAACFGDPANVGRT